VRAFETAISYWCALWSERFLAEKGLLAFIRRATCLEADFNVKREMRESFAPIWDLMPQNEATHTASSP